MPGGRPVEESRRSTKRCSSTTTCEEKPFPWQRSAPAATRLAEATGALNALPSTDFYPFDAATALDGQPDLGLRRLAGRLGGGARAGALPNVPTLILSGAQDLRTPTSNARRSRR